MQNNSLQSKDSVIVFSGGLDSTTLLYEQIERIALAITFNYGSNHAQREIECAKHHCNRLGVEHLIIDLDFIKQYFKSSLLSGAEAVPEGVYNNGNMQSTVVPFRNGIMISIACGVAESRGLRRLLIANHGGDHAIYPDCRPDFIDAMNCATMAGTYLNVSIDAPYTNISKGDIVKRGIALGIDYAETYSCYKGGEYHCGRCATCVERRQAFASAGVVDPTVYINR